MADFGAGSLAEKLIGVPAGAIEQKLIERGVPAAQARELSTQPWVQKLAVDHVYHGKELPKGMANMGAADVGRLQSQADKMGVPFSDVAQHEFLDTPFAKINAPMGTAAVAPEMASLAPAPKVGGGIQEALNAPVAPRPNATGGIQGILGDRPALGSGPSDAGWMANYPSGRVPSKQDLDTAIRTVYGEAAGGGPAEMQAVAQTIRNRSLETGSPLAAVSKAKGQFEPYMHADSRAKMANLSGADYQKVSDLVTPILTGEQPDKTGGFDHFYAPAAQKALGRGLPGFDDGTGVMAGRQKFFSAPHGKPYGNLPLPPVLAANAATPDALPPGGGIGKTIFDSYYAPPAGPPAPLVAGFAAPGGAQSAFAQANISPFAARGSVGMASSPSASAMARLSPAVATAGGSAPPPGISGSARIPAPPVPPSLAGLVGRSPIPQPMSLMPKGLPPGLSPAMQAWAATKAGNGAGLGARASLNPGMSVTGSASGGAPWGLAPQYGMAQFAKPPSVPPMLSGLVGRSPLPPPATMSMMPPAVRPGMGTSMLSGNYGMPLPGGLAASPMGRGGIMSGMMGPANPATLPASPMAKATMAPMGAPAMANKPGGSMALQQTARGASNVANILVAQLDAAMHAQENVHGDVYANRQYVHQLAPSYKRLPAMPARANAIFPSSFRPYGY